MFTTLYMMFRRFGVGSEVAATYYAPRFTISRSNVGTAEVQRQHVGIEEVKRINVGTR